MTQPTGDGESASRAAPPAASLREVLFASDLSNDCAISLSHARVLAERFSAHLALYHVLQAPRAPAGGAAPARDEGLVRRRETAARRHLSEHAAGLSVTWDAIVERAPSVATALLARLKRTRPDLLVMTTHRRAALAHLVLGSVTETVLERCECRLLCVREPDHGVGLPYRRVLVPTDLSDDSRRALPLAALLARAFAAEVLALHVVARPRVAPHGVGAAWFPERAASEDGLRRFVRPDLDGLRLTALIEYGPAGDGILRAARRHRPDVIVMATRRRDSLMDRIAGTHAERALREAPCPVLVA